MGTNFSEFLSHTFVRHKMLDDKEMWYLKSYTFVQHRMLDDKENKTFKILCATQNVRGENQLMSFKFIPNKFIRNNEFSYNSLVHFCTSELVNFFTKFFALC